MSIPHAYTVVLSDANSAATACATDSFVSSSVKRKFGNGRMLGVR